MNRVANRKSELRTDLKQAGKGLNRIFRNTAHTRNSLQSEWKAKSHMAQLELRELVSRIGRRIRNNKADFQADKLRDQMELQLSDWKRSVNQEVRQAYRTGRIKSRYILRKRALLTLGVASSVGIALGFLAAQKAGRD